MTVPTERPDATPGTAEPRPNPEAGDARKYGKKAKRPPLDLTRLVPAIQRSRWALRHFRNERREAIRDYCGSHYSENSAEKSTPLNLLDLWVTIVLRSLVAKEPRVKLSTMSREDRPAVKAAESWVNRQFEKINLKSTLQRWVYDAAFAPFGVLKVALGTPSDSYGTGYNLKAGEPYACVVDLDDFVIDMRAKCPEEATFVGHRCRYTLEAVKSDRRYERKYTKDLQPTPVKAFNETGDEKTERIAQGYFGQEEEWVDMVDVWELYLPHRKSIVTLLSDDGGLPITDYVLSEDEWVGPDCGPYHFLTFKPVPGNLPGKIPVTDLLDLHRFTNRLYRKLFSQADRQKETFAVAGDEDHKRLAEANDGEGFRSDRPDAVKQLVTGGPNPQNQAFAMHLTDRFNYQAGNIASAGGLEANSKTATQDQMLAANASKSIQDMQETTVSGTAGVVESLVWYYWKDPFKVMKTRYSPDAAPDVEIIQQVYPNNPRVHGNDPNKMVRKTPWEELDLRVDPYSIAHKTPEQRLAHLNQVVTQVVLPALPILQQQGIALDMNAFLAAQAELGDMPKLMEVVSIVEPPKQDGTTAAESGPGPSQTTRNYVRESQPGRTPMGDRQTQMQQLMNQRPESGQNNGNVKLPG